MDVVDEEFGFLERFERAAGELLGCLGTSAPDGPRVAELFAQCSSCAAGLPEVVERLKRADAERRKRAEACIQRILKLNAIAEAALRGEKAAVGELLERTRRVRARLEGEGDADVGESCDVRG